MQQYIQSPLSLQLESPLEPQPIAPQKAQGFRTPKTPVVDARVYGVPEFKRCRDCGEVKASKEFNRISASKDLLAHYCKSCSRARSKASWKKFDRKKERHETAYARRLQKEFGITIDQYQEMFESQHGVCAICGDPPGQTQRLAVDHDHDTGKVRALLCKACNVGLGYFKEDRERMTAAMAYLCHHGK